MKRLIVCSDGTWQRPDQMWAGKRTPTNVVKLKERISQQDGDVRQHVFYDPGVGTGHLLDRLLGGAFGVGLDPNILQAYEFLAREYAPGDQIYLFGFSRGAYTVRSLAGMIRKCGIVRDAARASAALTLYRDIALEWMCAKARTAGLAMQPVKPTHPNALASFNWIEGAALWELITADRDVGVDPQGNRDPSQPLNDTVLECWDLDGMYRPPGPRAYLKRVGDPRAVAPYTLGLIDKLRASLGF